MPITTLAELYTAGAQHTVEGVIAEQGFSFGLIIDALRRRFGEALQASDAQVEDFAFRVRQGMFAARRIENPDPAQPPDVPNIPGVSTGYNYTIIVSVPDPERPGDESRDVEVPLTVTSDEPLDIEELREQITDLLESWDPPRDTIPGGASADLIRRDMIVRSRMDKFGNKPKDIFTFNVISVFHGGV